MLTIEVGGSSTQAIDWTASRNGVVVSVAEHRDDAWLLAAPGLVEDDRVRGAHHLGWLDVRPSEELGMRTMPQLSMNDAEAAALGEWVLQGRPNDTLLYVSLGTGVGAIAVDSGRSVPIEFGHLTSFGLKRCGGCGRVGCMDAQIGGHALPNPLGQEHIEQIVTTLQQGIERQDIQLDRVVIGGGMVRRYPQIATDLQGRTSPPLELSASPDRFKSAAPYGLLHMWERAAQP